MSDTSSCEPLPGIRSAKETYAEGINRRIDEYFQVTKERIEDLLFLEEHEEDQLSEAKKLDDDLGIGILQGMKAIRIGLIESYERIFTELCDGFEEDAKKYQDSSDIISAHSGIKKGELSEVIRKARLAIGYLSPLQIYQ